MANINTYDYHQSQYQQYGFGKAVAWKKQSKITYHFHNHFHPYVDKLIGRLNRHSLAGLMDVKFHDSLIQNFFNSQYSPNTGEQDLLAVESEPKVIDVSPSGAYSIYNWELFFHLPMTVAVHHSKNQRFQEAQRWFHFIFDPTTDDTSVPAPQSFWRFLAFRNKTDVELIDEMLQLLAKPAAESTPAELKRKEEIIASIENWRDKPFQPHVIARTRFEAYQFQVVMKYLDNLIAWGDSLFRQDTIETLNEATQLYVLAANILGPKPQEVPRRGTVAPQTFASLRDKLDAFGNALVDFENQFPFNQYQPAVEQVDNDQTGNLLGVGKTLYFCIPPNEKLLGYWDTVADRLFKIRHCMNIEGVVRQLPLFQPPIDPGMLVKAVAAGLDLSSVINGLNTPPMPVRATFLIQKALEICNEVRGLGSSLLSALEKGDAEKLNLLRQRHDIAIQSMTRELRFLQWKEAEEQTESLTKSRQTALERYNYYQGKVKMMQGQQGASAENIGVSRAPLLEGSDQKEKEKNFTSIFNDLVNQNASEFPIEPYPDFGQKGASDPNVQSGAEGGGLLNLNLSEAMDLLEHLPQMKSHQIAAAALENVAPALAQIPQFPIDLHYWGLGGTIEFGGDQLSKGARFAANILSKLQSIESIGSQSASKTGGFGRRVEDWTLQLNQSAREINHIGRQIMGSILREQITKKEYDNQAKQLEFSREIDDFMKDKFTGEQLYIWMQSELSKVYYDCYQLAFDIARRAEQAVKREIMRPEMDQRDFLKFNYWDGGRRGLLSGDALYLDLKRLEMAYHENNKRELELTKHISLRQVDPVALLELKATGACTVTLPEWIFDLDAPGHYMRRIKTVSLSLPCVAGPYTSVSCSLSLQRSSIRTASILRDGEYPRAIDEVDDRFQDYFGVIQQIVTSTGQNDSGLFELNLRDERSLPFEGAGVISTWRLELPGELRQFDYNSISDAILHMRYTARPGGGLLKTGAETYISDEIIANANNSGLARVFNLKRDFPNAWQQFQSGTGPFQTTIRRDMFPYFAQAGDLLPDTDNTSLEMTLWELADEQLQPLPLTRPEISDTLPLGGGMIIAHELSGLNEAGRKGDLHIARTSLEDKEEVFLVIYYKVEL